MAKIVSFILLVLFILVPATTFSQNRQADINDQRLLLNLAWGFLYVVRQNQVDRDSTLSQSSRVLNIDPLILITQNNEAPFYGNKHFNSGEEELRFLKNELPKYSGKENVRLLNSIGWMYTFQQGNLNVNLDSAHLYLERAKLAGEKLQDHKGYNEALCYLGLYYYKRGEAQSADSCLQTAIAQCKKSGNKIGEALALGYKAVYYPFRLCPVNVRIDGLQKALELYRQLNDKQAQALTLINTAYFLFVNHEVAECKKLTLESLLLQKEIGFPFTHYTTDLLALVSFVEGNHANFLKYALESIRTIDATKDTVGAAYFYARAGDAYYAVGNKAEECVRWYLRALDEFRKSGGDLSMYKLLNDLARQMDILGRSREAIELIESLMKQYPPVNAMDKQNMLMALGGAYFKIGQIDASGKYYQQAEKLEPAVQAVSGNENTGYINYTIGFYYFNTKQYEKSRPYFMKVLNNQLSAGVGLVAFNDIHLALFSVDSAAGHYHDAVKHLREYTRLNDSIYSEKQSKQIQEWDILYKTEKKEKDLQLLTKDNQVKELGLKKAAFTRNVIVASALLLLALLLIGYLLKQRNNVKLKLHQDEINEQNQQLQTALAKQQKLITEKDWLVKEIHHRVKNNLQIVISLLNVQSGFLDSPSALTAVRESRERMEAIALIHQKLYQTDYGTLIKMKSYIEEMVGYLRNFADAGKVHFRLETDDVAMDVSQAVPLSLILNEAITNALKYAFPGDRHGNIKIALRQMEGENIFLQIADDGQGFPENFSFSGNKSLGIQLIKLFSEQLEASLRFENSNGAHIELRFKKQLPIDTA
jgi:two-component sensor histidine kinase